MSDPKYLYVWHETTIVTAFFVQNFNNKYIEPFRSQEIKNVKQVLKINHDLNAPSITILKVLARNDIVHNILILHSNIYLVEKVFKGDVSTVKGNDVINHHLVASNEDFIQLRVEMRSKVCDMELSINTVFINNKKLLCSVDRTIKLKSLSTLWTKKKGQG